MESKTAKEMFEQLRYKLIEKTKARGVLNWELLYEFKDCELGRTVRVRFVYDSCYVQLLEENKIIGGAGISAKLHLAIHQQMKELGWIE